MKINTNPFNQSLHYLGLSEAKVNFVVIGAMDGISFDDFHSFVRSYRWSGLLVEPIPEQFRRLVSNYTTVGCSPDNRYENSAVAEHNGTTQMLTINQEAVDDGKVHACFGGMSAIYPPRNGLASDLDAETVRQFGQLIEVPCMTLQTLLAKHQILAFDIFCIDAEGWDLKILRQLDFSVWRPKLIRIEYINLSDEEKLEVVNLFDAHDYNYSIEGMNIDAVDIEFWDRVNKEQIPISRKSILKPYHHNLTVVSSLMHLVLEHNSDAHSTYQMAHSQLQSLNEGQRLIVFTPPGPAELAARERSSASTLVIRRSLEDFSSQEHYALIYKAHVKLSGPVENLETDAMRSWLSLSAPFLLHDASIFNPFGTENFLWVDSSAVPAMAKGLNENLPAWNRVIEQIVHDTRIWQPAGAAPNRQALEHATQLWLESPLESLLFSVTGQALGGAIPAIHVFNGIYYACLDRLLQKGELCSLSEVLTLVAHSHRYLLNIQRGTGLGIGT
jgi:FkbM family methyltransferase